jgi:putative FmdB family regulatory protein
MPTYEYVCANGHVNIEVRSITIDSQLTQCQEEGCDATEFNRLFSPVTAIYKGKGFYSVDSRTELLKPGQQVDW